MTSKRRGRGEGSIQQRADGRWCAQVSLGYKPNGKRDRRTVSGATKAKCQQKLREIQKRQDEGTLTEPTKMTVAEFLTHWLATSVKPSFRRTTYRGYSRAVETHVKPRIGGVALCKLNVCSDVDAPRRDTPEMEVLDARQAATFLAATEGDRLHALYVLAVTTGLRWGELCGLKWSDIDIDAGTLSVRRIIAEVDGEKYLSEPKTQKGKRLVELPATAIEALHVHRRRMMVEGFAGQEWAFVSVRGKWLDRRNVHKDSFKPALKRAGLPDIKFHALRHTAATLMLSAGVHAKVVSERLGHATIAITLDTYSHVLPSMQKDACAKLDALLKAATA